MSSTLGAFNKDKALTGVTRDQLDLLLSSWPEHFGCLFDMGLRAFESLFNYRPTLLNLFHVPPGGDWKRDETIKKIVLSLEQTLVKAVGTFGERNPDEAHTVADFISMMQDIGGMHRAMIPQLTPDNFEVLFRLLPEVIVDVISSRRKSGPLEPFERATLITAWSGICNLMAANVVLGWERRVTPRLPKFAKPCRSEQSGRATTSSGGKRSSLGGRTADAVVGGTSVTVAGTSGSSSSGYASGVGDGGESTGNRAAATGRDGGESVRRQSVPLSGSQRNDATRDRADRRRPEDEMSLMMDERIERGTLLLGDVRLCLCNPLDDVSVDESIKSTTSESPEQSP